MWPDTVRSNLPPDAFAIGRQPQAGGPEPRDSVRGDWHDVGVPGMPTYSGRLRAYQDSVAYADSVRTAAAGIDFRAARMAAT